ncbi:MAG: hypothetical protein WC593_15235 [Methanoregula sp.]
MFREIVAHLKMRLKKTAKAIKAGFVSVTYHRVTPSVSAYLPFSGYVIPTGAVQALNLGLRYRITSGHAPIFSLFTFFGNRQTPVSGI